MHFSGFGRRTRIRAEPEQLIPLVPNRQYSRLWTEGQAHHGPKARAASFGNRGLAVRSFALSMTPSLSSVMV